MDYTLPDLSFVPGDQGFTTVDITGGQTDASGTYQGISLPTNLTGAPQYPGDPTADTGSNSFAAASSSTIDLLPSSSQLSQWITDAGNLIGAGTAAFAAANQFTRVPVNTGNGIRGNAIVNANTGLPAGSATLAQAFPRMGNIPTPLILAGLAALYFALRK